MRNQVQTILCCVLVSLGTATVYGQDDTTKLEELSLKQLLNLKITTASRTAQSLGLSSAAVIVVTSEQIKERNYRSLLDVLQDLPSIKVDDKMYSGIRNSITIRGIQGSQNFVLMLNGIVISTPSGEAMPIMENYPVHLAEQIEVVYGPASALYGANAVSGVINIITKRNERKKQWQVEGATTAGTHGYTNTSLFLNKKLNSHMNLTLAGQYFYDRGPDYSKHHKQDSLFNMSSHSTGVFNTIYGPMQPKTPVKAVYEMPMEAYNIYAGVQSEYFSFNFFRNHFRLPNGYENNPDNAVYNRDVFVTQSITMASASYKRKFKKITSTTTLMGSEYNLDPQSNYRNLYTHMERAYKYATSNLFKGEQQIDIKASKKMQLTTGAGYEAFSSIPQSADLAAPVNSNNFIAGTIAGTQAYYKPEGLPATFYYIKFYNIGSFVQALYTAHAKLNLTLGARYDYNSRYGASFNPRMGLVYKPSQRTTIKLLYGSAFLAPSPSTAYAQYGSVYTTDSGRSYRADFLHLPNPKLKPIRSYNTELNIIRQVSDNIIVKLNAYFTILKGLYAYADDNATTRLYNNQFNGIPVDYVEVFVNRNRQNNYGGSLQLNWKHYFGRLRMNAFASLSYVDGMIHDDTDPQKHRHLEIDFVAPVMGRVGADLKIGKFSTSPRLLIMGRQRLPGLTADNKRQTINGYQLLNVSLRYQCSKRWAVFSTVTNALDQRYRNVSFNMDLDKKDTELFYGQHQDPIRIIGGLQLSL